VLARTAGAAGTPTACAALSQADNGCLDQKTPNEHSIGQTWPIATGDGSHGSILGCLFGLGRNLRDFRGRPGAKRQFFFSRTGCKFRCLGAAAGGRKYARNAATDIQRAGLVHDDAAVA
jgi:hypothetical protein